MLFAHGLPKLSAYSTKAQFFPDPLGVGNEMSMALAIFAEVVCAGLIAIGLFTRLNALILTFNMLVAALIVHGADPFAKMEMALLYAFAYGATALLGGGNLGLQPAVKGLFQSRNKFIRWVFELNH
ncbi:MAG: DoxX family protein [Bdellovibrionaceae bacterium]|nr:DoxX family protein [Pseudobdellovibrionaceae bacterium]